MQHDIKVLHALASSTEIVAAQEAVESIPQHLNHGLAPPRQRGIVPHVQVGAEKLGPQSLTILFVAGLVYVQTVFRGYHRRPGLHMDRPGWH